MKKVIKFNTGYLVDLAGVAILASVGYWLYSKDEKGIRFIWITLFLAVIIIGLYLFFTETKLTNESDKSVFAKPEEGDEPNEVKPNETLYGLDGVKAKGTVYKLVDGTHATVTETGEVKIHSLFSKTLNAVSGGELTAPPDKGWQKLFEK